MPRWLPMALVSIALGAIGQVLLKLASRGGTLSLFGPGMGQSLLRLALNPYFLVGVVCFVSSMLVWVKVLSSAQLATAYPVVSLGYVLVAALSWVFLGEHINVRQAVAIGVIIAGVVMLGRG